MFELMQSKANLKRIIFYKSERITIVNNVKEILNFFRSILNKDLIEA